MSLSAFQRLVQFAKITALLSAVWTILCAALIIGLQVFSGEWNAYRLSSVIESLKRDQNSVYVTASSNKSETEWTIADWLLELPAIVPLLIIAALLLAFYLRLAVLAKEAPKN